MITIRKQMVSSSMWAARNIKISLSRMTRKTLTYVVSMDLGINFFYPWHQLFLMERRSKNISTGVLKQDPQASLSTFGMCLVRYTTFGRAGCLVILWKLMVSFVTQKLELLFLAIIGLQCRLSLVRNI